MGFCRSFFAWYNTEHRHSGIGMLTPEVVHYGLAGDVIESGKQALEVACEAHPERFVRGVPLPQAALINPPVDAWQDRRKLQ